MKVYNGFSELVGTTPLVRLANIERELSLGAALYAKLESANPAGSAKDRVALKIIEDLEREGKISHGSVIIEPTSGNTGIALAAICASRGYRAIIVMPSSMSEERKALVRAYGAELVLTDGALGMKGAIDEAKRLAATISGSVIAGQFVNPSNPRAHECSTGPEIYEDTDGGVDIFVAGVGTGGTITGVGHYLKAKKPSVRVVGVEPSDSAVLSGGSAGAHGIQGIGAGFIPDVLDRDIIDAIYTATLDEAKEAMLLIARCEGLLVGISSGAALSAAIAEAKLTENEGKCIAVLLPDSAERYLSLGIF